jgi:hypothetical protein
LTAKRRSSALKAVTGTLLALLLLASAARAGELRLPFSRYRLPDMSTVGESSEDDGRGSQVLIGEDEEEEGSETGKKIAGAIMFGSGVLLCSWGIVDWQTSDTQCCPARNTENIAKIVVGVVLLNAGLVYLIAGGL